MIEAPQVEADSLKDSTTTRKRKLVKTTTTDLYVSDIGFHHCKALLDTYWGVFLYRWALYYIEFMYSPRLQH